MHALSQLGKSGEDFIANLLEKRGYKIRAKNYKSRQGEIDVIASKDDLLLFIEVKVRINAHFNISLVVDYAKQRKIIKTALRYVWEHKLSDMTYRFDVALLELSVEKGYTINYIPNAFTAPESSERFF